MTDHDSPDPSAPDPPAPDVPSSGPRPAPGGSPTAGTALRDSWWWSPTLMLVVGIVVAGYQLDSLRSPDPLWVSWAVAGVGVLVALIGLVRLASAYRSR